MSSHQGMAWLCRQCTHYSQTKNKGMEICGARLQNKPCGSPLFGMSFPLYQGPVTDFTRFCFVCGDKATLGLRVPGGDRKFGLCGTDHGAAWVNRILAYFKQEGLLGAMLGGNVELAGKRDFIPAEETPFKKNLYEHAKEYEEKAARKYGPDENRLKMAKQAEERGESTKTLAGASADGAEPATGGGVHPPKDP